MYALIGLGRVVYYYQTLTAGGDAVVAAYHAAPPVYRQLGMMRLQSGAVMRGMLLDLFKETLQLSAKTSLRFSHGPEVAFPQSARFLPTHVT